MKQRPEYKSLPLILRNIVDYMVRRHESPAEGITVSQGRGKGLTPGLSERFEVSRKTMNKYLGQIVEAGVLTVEKRYRGPGTKGGRTTNRYRLNDALFSQPVTHPATQRVTTEATHIEGPKGPIRSSLRSQDSMDEDLLRSSLSRS